MGLSGRYLTSLVALPFEESHSPSAGALRGILRVAVLLSH